MVRDSIVVLGALKLYKIGCWPFVGVPHFVHEAWFLHVLSLLQINRTAIFSLSHPVGLNCRLLVVLLEPLYSLLYSFIGVLEVISSSLRNRNLVYSKAYSCLIVDHLSNWSINYLFNQSVGYLSNNPTTIQIIMSTQPILAEIMTKETFAYLVGVVVWTISVWCLYPKLSHYLKDLHEKFCREEPNLAQDPFAAQIFLQLSYNKQKDEIARLQGELSDLRDSHTRELSGLRKSHKARESGQVDLIASVRADNRVLEKKLIERSANNGTQRIFGLINMLGRKDDEIRELHEGLERAEQRFVATRKEIEAALEARSEMSRVEAENSQLNATITDLNNEIKASHTTKRQLEDECSGLQYENTILRIEARDIRSEKRRLKTTNLRLEANITSLTRERKSLTSELRNAKAVLASNRQLGASARLEVEIAGVRQERHALTAELQNARAMSAQAQKALLQSQDDERSATAKITALLEEVALSNNKAQALTAELQDTTAKSEQAQQALLKSQGDERSAKAQAEALLEEVSLLKDKVRDANHLNQQAPADAERATNQPHEQASNVPVLNVNTFAAIPRLSSEQFALLRVIEKLVARPHFSPEQVAPLRAMERFAKRPDLTEEQFDALRGFVAQAAGPGLTNSYKEQFVVWERMLDEQEEKEREKAQEEAKKHSTRKSQVVRCFLIPQMHMGMADSYVAFS